MTPDGKKHLETFRALGYPFVPAVALGYLLFATLPDLWAALGTAVVIGAGLYVLHRRHAG